MHQHQSAARFGTLRLGGPRKGWTWYGPKTAEIPSRNGWALSSNCKDTESLFTTGKTKRFTSIKSVAERKLQQLDSAVTLDFLKAPPGNQLELLTGDRAGQHSIRINKQWRVCFEWTSDGPANVEIVDYH